VFPATIAPVSMPGVNNSLQGANGKIIFDLITSLQGFVQLDRFLQHINIVCIMTIWIITLLIKNENIRIRNSYFPGS